MNGRVLSSLQVCTTLKKMSPEVIILGGHLFNFDRQLFFCILKSEILKWKSINEYICQSTNIFNQTTSLYTSFQMEINQQIYLSVRQMKPPHCTTK